jgi:nondiscriminating glutamyl-tRNA synthetase
MSKLKVRFAPSPTGPLHIGGARSALFNYLAAAHSGGEMVLRIEDTDLDRSRREYEDEIIESLRWLGLDWSEGIDIGGANGPYRQTERLDIYQAYINKLLESGHAYYCFCTEAELEADRQELLSKGELPRYLGKCRNLTPQECQNRISQGQKPVVRFRVPEDKVYTVNDLVRGQVNFESSNIGDFIIAKSDGIPTYNFAVVIDDYLMGITDVIRAEEHLSNTPRQLMIYDALGFAYPRFAHISLILGEDHQKMSKRHGATSLVQYRDMGYMPEAMFNFLALLGWSPEGEEQILSPDQIITAFTLDRVSKSPAVFDLDKLNWINQQYLKQKTSKELLELLMPFIAKTPYQAPFLALPESKRHILVEAVRDYLVGLSDIKKYLELFFTPADYDPEALQVLKNEAVPPILQAFAQETEDFETPEQAKQIIKAFIKQNGLKPKDVYMPLRSALTGSIHGPELNSLLCIWGRQECRNRIDQALKIRD